MDTVTRLQGRAIEARDGREVWCPFCLQDGRYTPATRCGAQSDDQGVNVTWTVMCDDHGYEWASSGDWEAPSFRLDIRMDE